MYDVFVVANRDSEQLRIRFRPLEKLARVRYVIDRSAIAPNQYPGAIRDSGHEITTDYYFVIRGDQELVRDPMEWLRYDIEKPSVVLWPVGLVSRAELVPRHGMCLFPADATGGFEYEWVDESDAFTLVNSYPSMEFTNWYEVKDVLRDIESPYLIVYGAGTKWVPSNTPLVDQTLLGDWPNPVMNRGDEVLAVPAMLANPDGPLEVLMRNDELSWPMVWNWTGVDIREVAPIRYDIFMLSNGETLADKHWDMLSRQYPRAKRIDRVQGILNAHVVAADQSQTDYFWVIDADNVLMDNVNLDLFRFPTFAPQSVRVWRAENNVNGLKYGNGGIKLFPTAIVRSLRDRDMDRDFTGMVAAACPGRMTVMPGCWSLTVIDSTPYEAWRAAYREVAKLASQINEARRNGIGEEHVPEMIDRHRVWATESRTSNGTYAWRGARAALSLFCSHDPPVLARHINNERIIREAFERDEQHRLDRPELSVEHDENHKKMLREGKFWNAG